MIDTTSDETSVKVTDSILLCGFAPAGED
jgi:hypothetical protein